MATVLQRITERVMAARHSGTPLDIRGGSTKTFYGNLPRGEALDLRDLSGIVSYEPTELVITVLAGTPLEEVDAALATCGQCLPFDPPRFGAGGTVGGMIAAGLAGPSRARVGPLRDYVLGVSMLNGRGEWLRFGGQVMKNVAGYDVSRVLAGSMGILGVLCEMSLKVMPRATACRTIRMDIDEPAALKLLNRWSRATVPLDASAWYAGQLHVRYIGAKAAVERVAAPAGSQAVEPEAAAEWWRDVRDHRHQFFAFSDAPTRGGHASSRGGASLWRLSVPDTAPPIHLPGEQFIEWGGAQRWLRSDAPALEIRAAALAARGHATLFRTLDRSADVFATLTPPLMQIHRRLKESFDPAGILNPGRLYAEL